ncbi:MAG TPA: MCE family protein [Pseudonocardiaceae bacterium]|nr:MCE family protein [Pseudonocardiaceae bacterium]
MTQPIRRKSLAGPLVKSAVFVVVTALATALLALTISNGSVSAGTRYQAVFTDATAVQAGDDIRMAGVRIGQVDSVTVTDRRQATVTFTVQPGDPLTRTVTAAIRYENLIGQRYIALDQGTGSLADPLPAGATIDVHHTQPALDLTALFNGFQPLFQALSPQQVNQLAGEIIQVFQGEGPTVDDLLGQTASLTSTLADKTRVIDQVIDNLNAVLGTVQSTGNGLRTLVDTLTSFVQGLAADRASLGRAISGIGELTTDVGSLVGQARDPLHSSLQSLQALSANLGTGGANGPLNSFLQTLPTKLTTIGRLASYGSWLNFYLCSINGRIPLPGEDFGESDEKYTGGVGAQPVEARCQS